MKQQLIQDRIVELTEYCERVKKKMEQMHRISPDFDEAFRTELRCYSEEIIFLRKLVD